VPQGAIRCDPVAHTLLELLELGEPALGGARPDGLAVQSDLEDPFVAWSEGDFLESVAPGSFEISIPSATIRSNQTAAPWPVPDWSIVQASSPSKLLSTIVL
jgi:hypothetical protein